MDNDAKMEVEQVQINEKLDSVTTAKSKVNLFNKYRGQAVLISLMIGIFIVHFLLLSWINYKRCLISLYSELTTIITLLTLVVTILIIHNDSLKRIPKNILIVICVSLMLLSCSSILLHKQFGIVPNIYGRTYDEAICDLRDAGFDGHLVLSNTNRNLSSSDSRIVWQSSDSGSIERRDTTIAFAIDDSFATEYKPLLTSSSEKPGKISWVYTPTADNEMVWEISIDLYFEQISYQINVPIINNEGSVNGFYYETHYMLVNDNNAEDMKNTINEILLSFMSSKDINFSIDFSQEYSLVIKLLPDSNFSARTVKIETDKIDINERLQDQTPGTYSWISQTNYGNGPIDFPNIEKVIYLLPSEVYSGKYTLAFSFISNDGNADEYQWCHNLTCITANDALSSSP